MKQLSVSQFHLLSYFLPGRKTHLVADFLVRRAGSGFGCLAPSEKTEKIFFLR